MKPYYLFIGILLSLLIHILFFSNISLYEIDKSTHQDLIVELITMPPISSENLIAKSENKKKGITKASREPELKEAHPIITENQIESSSSNLSENPQREELQKEILCDLCEPVKDILITEEEDSYGEKIQSIKIQYKVLHELGPNKGSINNVKPFGQSKENKKNIRNEVGTLDINYLIDGNNYTITYEAKANGLTSLIYSKPLIQRSEGSINEYGLKPDYYIYEYGQKKKNEAFFDWKNQKLKIVRKSEEKLFNLIEGTQDQLSFMFQFMFLNPLNKMQMPITNAKIFKTYNYQYIDEGIMTTDIGNINFIHVAKFNYQDPERIDLWLAKDYGFLPFKISITDEDLSIIIQEVHQIQVKKND